MLNYRLPKDQLPQMTNSSTRTVTTRVSDQQMLNHVTHVLNTINSFNRAGSMHMH
uniref:Uncharacterized protein n=1 Tax=Arundo donax TaxID=35708 RepID=A0A0A9GE33_ARUDO